MSGTITDAVGDGPSAETDFGEFSWTISGEELTFLMDMPNLIQPIPVNRPGINPGFPEYEWSVQIDVDNDPYTGTPSTSLGEGADYKLSISYFHSFSSSDLLYLNQMQWDLWEYSEANGFWESVATPDLTAPPLDNAFQIVGTVPGLDAQSKLMPFTFYSEPFTSFFIPDTFGDCFLENTDRVFSDAFE
ncbi:MAG: hypothetical protein GVY32_02295 [Gammaproteobacteria bacterium]|jgi:hypothetical protein|nr:hypothetical protein [Gammaproteobacteria bacterium]